MKQIPPHTKLIDAFSNTKEKMSLIKLIDDTYVLRFDVIYSWRGEAVWPQ